MEKVKITAIVAVIAIVIAGAAVALTTMNDNGNSSGSVTVTDTQGREVTIDSCDRIISVTASATSILCGLGLSSNIVAVTSDDDIYSEESSIIGLTDDDFPTAIIDGIEDGTITELGAMYHISAETIASVEADLVICDDYGTNEDTWNALDDLGITYIVITSPYSVDEIYSNIELIGDATGTSSEADTLMSEMSSAIQKICDWCASIVEDELDGEKYSVALMMIDGYAIGTGYMGGDILTELGVENAFESIATYASVTEESMVEANPDIIIYNNLEMGGVTDAESFIEEFCTDDITGNINAAENDLVFATMGGASNVASFGAQGIVCAYAMYAMFIYKDYLTFDIPNVLDSSNYSDYIAQFWAMINDS